jgi:hypothetical protein
VDRGTCGLTDERTEGRRSWRKVERKDEWKEGVVERGRVEGR